VEKLKNVLSFIVKIEFKGINKYVNMTIKMNPSARSSGSL